MENEQMEFDLMIQKLLSDFDQQEQGENRACLVDAQQVFQLELPSSQPQALENIPSQLPLHKKNVLAERERRKRESELLRTLKSLIPFHTKRDKLSILQGAVRYVQDLQAECSAEREAGETPCSSDRSTKPNESNLIRLTVHPEFLISALSQLNHMGIEVFSLQMNSDEGRAEIVVHSTVGVPSSEELQQMVNQESVSVSPMKPGL